jgi:hypothetical protein
VHPIAHYEEREPSVKLILSWDEQWLYFPWLPASKAHLKSKSSSTQNQVDWTRKGLMAHSNIFIYFFE